jgi:branched-chain amino acid transport system ATP-binding protein
MPMPATALEVRNLSAGYGPTRIIEDISLDIRAGDRLAVLGRNGMGKTTLLATLMGLTTRHGGDIKLGAQDLTARRTSATVAENLRAGLKGRPLSALDEAYEMFPRLRERRGNYGKQLSGGEQQMLAMARTLLGKPSILLLDEPLEGLAPVICDELMAMLVQLAASGDVTIILVEQQIERALGFANSVMVMERGRTSWTGTPDVLIKDRGLVDRLVGVGIH